MLLQAAQQFHRVWAPKSLVRIHIKKKKILFFFTTIIFIGTSSFVLTPPCYFFDIKVPYSTPADRLRFTAEIKSNTEKKRLKKNNKPIPSFTGQQSQRDIGLYTERVLCVVETRYKQTDLDCGRVLIIFLFYK